MYYETIGVATRSDENERNRSQVNTRLFRSSLDLPHDSEDMPVSTTRWKERNVTVMLMSQLYCLGMGRGFSLKKTANLLFCKRNVLF